MAPRNNKKKTKKQKNKKESSQSTIANNNDNNNNNIVSSLIDQGQNALQNMELETAEELFVKALSMDSSNTNIMDALADIQLQLGETEKAKDLLLQSTLLLPLTNPYKWLFLGQLQSGNDAVDSYRSGISILNTILNTVNVNKQILYSIYY